MISPVIVAALGVPMLLSGLLAASSKNLVRAVLWLGVMLGLTSMLFAALGAGFLATVQVLLYIGGVVTLLIFGVMLTSHAGGTALPRPTRRRLPAAIVSLGLFAALASVILKAGEPQAATEGPSTADLAGTLLGKDLLAFEVLSVLLLAAMIGAIVLARARDAGEPSRDPAGEPKRSPR